MHRYDALSNDRETESLTARRIYYPRRRKLPVHYDSRKGKKRLTTLTQSSISMTFCKAAIDPAIFPRPNVFLPERWTDGWQEALDYERYILPFGRGSRVCIGQQ